MGAAFLMSLAKRFAELDAFLTTYQSLWRPRPFYYLTLPWEHEYLALSTWLRQRSLEEAEATHNTPFSLNAPEPFATLAKVAQRLCHVDQHPAVNSQAEPSGVPGRKWQQIQAFSHALRFNKKPTHYLDWCAGKGHLGRHLAKDTAALTLLEFDAYLVTEGQKLSHKQGIHATHHCQDVLHDSVLEKISADMTPVALHACGDLHTQLVKIAAHSVSQVAIAPCCYNRIATPSYEPLSKEAKQSSLCLSLDDLALPLSETVTAGNRVRRLRDQSMAWRLGFDLLQREVRQTQDYLPTPSLPSHWLNGTFQAFCEHLACLKGIALPSSVNWPLLEQQGFERLAAVRNLELVRSLFRRPLELWLLLDKALYLEAHGFSAYLSEFCPSQLSPRNLLLQAQKPL